MVESFSRQEARAGLQGITTLAIGYYVFLLAVMIWQGSFPPLLLLNRVVSLSIFAWVRWRFVAGRLPPEHYCRWSLFLGSLGLLSLSISYVLGFNSYVSARITVIMVFGALVGLPSAYFVFHLCMCLATCVFLQHLFPTPTDPDVNLAIPCVGLVLSLSIFWARRRTGRVLFTMSEELHERGRVLEETLEQARQLQASLDQDVALATSALEKTNQKLVRAIEEQIITFGRSQQLQREMGDKLRFQALGKAAGAAAHDLNNLLAVILGSLELIESEIHDQGGPEGQKILTWLNQELNRCVLVGREVLALSGKYLLRNDEFELASWLRKVLKSLPQDLPLGRFHLDEAPEELWLRCDQSQLESALLKLLRNAHEACPEGTTRLRPTKQGDRALLTIEDEGPGVPARVVAHLFEPFVTTKDSSLHSGLGLAAARSIMRLQGGEVSYLGPRANGRGSSFSLSMLLRGPHQ